MRLACDTGGTFTDLLCEDDDGRLHMYKAPTTPDDPVRGVIDVVQLAAREQGQSTATFLGRASAFIHGTTHAINAIITGRTARTVLLTTQGHRDVLLLREGGRRDPFNPSIAYPAPLIPRSLTFEVPERIGSAGQVIEPLDEAAVSNIIRELQRREIQAVAVCFLWSTANAAHERRVGELLATQLPGIPFTLSHALNPALREYRRASSAALDASLKPLMGSYLGSLAERLNAVGFAGRLLVLTSQGGMADAADIARAPIHAINSGPSLAPVAGRHFVGSEGEGRDVVVADTGGTTYDVSLVRNGIIPLTRETWIGLEFSGHITGFPSVDVKSVGAGGGSIARVDNGGVLHVGPQSAGAVPGPACYGRGGTAPTVTDACVVLGYVDPDFFLGGSMRLDLDAARRSLQEQVARPLGRSLEEAAEAVIAVATENMAQAIADITVNQGIDPARSVLVGGGGAAGLNSIFIARRLGIRTVVIPETGAALSAAGALLSELSSDHRATRYTNTRQFDYAAANRVLEDLEANARNFLRSAGGSRDRQSVDFLVEARYEHQVWEIEVPLRVRRFEAPADVASFVAAFHAMHEKVFSFADPQSAIEIIGWSARARCRVHEGAAGRLTASSERAAAQSRRRVYLPGRGYLHSQVLDFDSIAVGQERSGPAIVESPFTTVVLDEDCTFERDSAGSLVIQVR